MGYGGVSAWLGLLSISGCLSFPLAVVCLGWRCLAFCGLFLVWRLRVFLFGFFFGPLLCSFYFIQPRLDVLSPFSMYPYRVSSIIFLFAIKKNKIGYLLPFLDVPFLDL